VWRRSPSVHCAHNDRYGTTAAGRGRAAAWGVRGGGCDANAARNPAKLVQRGARADPSREGHSAPDVITDLDFRVHPRSPDLTRGPTSYTL